MSERHEVRKSALREAQGAVSLSNGEGPGVRGSDDVLDRVIASLTDVSPSPALKANVMRRVAETRAPGLVRRSESPKVRRSPVRLAFAAAAVILVAVASWFALTPATPRETARTPPAAPVIAQPLPRTGGEAAQARSGTAAPQIAIRVKPGPASQHATRSRSAAESAEQLEPVNELPPVSPIEMRPIPDPAPVTMTPLTMKPIEIPEIEIRPIDEPPADTSRPSKQDSDKKQPGGSAHGANR